MIKQRLTIDKTDSGYVLCVDGGSIECATEAELMSRVGAEMGMPYMKANRMLFEKYKILESERSSLNEMREIAEKDRDKYKAWWNAAYEENRQLKAAIVKWFLRAFKEG
jgi:hypothetical protein